MVDFWAGFALGAAVWSVLMTSLVFLTTHGFVKIGEWFRIEW